MKIPGIQNSIGKRLSFYLLVMGLVFTMLVFIMVTFASRSLLNFLIINQLQNSSQLISQQIQTGYVIRDTRSLLSFIALLKKMSPDIKEVTIADSQGVITADSDEEKLEQKLKGKESDMALKKGAFTCALLKKDNRDFGIVYAPIKAGNNVLGVLKLSIRLSQLENIKRQLSLAKSIAFFVLFLIVVLPVFAGFFILQKQISKPLSLVMAAAENIADGDLSQKEIVVQSMDETGQLGQIFNKMTANLKDLSVTAEKIAEGDLTTSIRIRSDRDVLAGAFMKMLENLKSLILKTSSSIHQVSSLSGQLIKHGENIGQSADQIAMAVDGVSKGAVEEVKSIEESLEIVNKLIQVIEQIAKGAQEQAQSVEVTSTSVHQMSKSIENVVKDVQELSSVSLQTKSVAQQGKNVVDKTSKGMDDINATLLEFSGRVQELGRRSSEIGEIVKVIDDIAKQTNLLALNAAIEAARAGEHGKGFAVVASEVRKLAEKSSKATKEIAGLINTTRGETEETVRSMKTVTQEVKENSKLIQNTISAFEEIVNAVEKTNLQVVNISENANKISAATSDVVKSMDNVASIVEENTAATEEMAASSHQVGKAISNIASISEENSASAAEVSSSVEKQNDAIAEIVGVAKELDYSIQELNAQIGLFKTK